MDGFHNFLRCFLRPKMLEYAFSGLHSVAVVQRIRSPALDRIMQWTAWSVSVEFYATFLPLLVWIGHWQLACRLTYLMAVCLYTGNALKDLLSIPRPFSLTRRDGRPIRKVGTQKGSQKTDNEEYGLPSTHALNGLCFSIYALVELIRQEKLEGLYIAFATSMTLFWIFLVCFGRVYLGMHCPVDVVMGLALGACILPVWCKFDRYLVPWLLHSDHILLQHMAIVAGLILIYPRPASHTPSFKYCMSFFGASIGLLMSVLYGNSERLENMRLDLSKASCSAVICRRILFGLAITVMLKKLSKSIGMDLLRRLGLGAESGTRICKPVKGKHTVDTLHLVVHMSSYGVLGWSTFYLCPLLFEWLEI